MRKILAIIIVSYILFLVEYVLFNLFGGWAKPNLLLVFVVFCNLYAGIRYSLFAAGFAGILRDVFSVDFLGTHIFGLMVCALLTTYLRRHYYQRGSRFSRFVMVIAALFLYSLLMYSFQNMRVSLDFSTVFQKIFFPEFILTSIFALHLMDRWKYWAQRMML